MGIIWNTHNDSLAPDKFHLDPKASTKRQILSSIASNYDIFNVNGPLLNRARLFLHTIQLREDLDWDHKIPDRDLKEWSKFLTKIFHSKISR